MNQSIPRAGMKQKSSATQLWEKHTYDRESSAILFYSVQERVFYAKAWLSLYKNIATDLIRNVTIDDQGGLTNNSASNTIQSGAP